MTEQKNNTPKSSVQRFFSGIAILWPVKMAFSLLMLVYAVYTNFNQTPNISAQVVGIIFVLAGASIELLHYHIIKKKAGPLGLPNSLVSEGGLLKLIRHPMYFGDVIMVFGLGFISNYYGLIGSCVFLMIVMGLCVQEDRMMKSQFPDDFKAWSTKSKRLIPFIW